MCKVTWGKIYQNISTQCKDMVALGRYKIKMFSRNFAFAITNFLTFCMSDLYKPTMDNYHSFVMIFVEKPLKRELHQF